MPPDRVLFIDDDDEVRDASLQRLQLAGLNAETFASGNDALAVIDPTFRGVVVTDIRMPDIDGHQLFEEIHARDPEIPVIFISGHAHVGEAVASMKGGVYDFLVKPYATEDLIHSVERAIERRRLVLENRQLRSLADEAQAGWPLIGTSAAMERLRNQLRMVAEADVDVLVEGETGVGKELAARAIHGWGKRRNHPFVPINLAAIPLALVESELFGHDIGAFPGAVRQRTGLIEYANRGTLFLDAIEAIPPEIQVKLLRFLSEREITPLGANQPRSVDVRIVAAFKTDLAQPVTETDLYHRLNVVKIEIPPLRRRREDIPGLFAHFLARAADRARKEPPEISTSTRLYLDEHEWPGNIRELANFAEKLALGLDVMAAEHESPSQLGLRERLDAYEAELIRRSLAAHNGNVMRVMEELKLPKVTFYAHAHRLNINLEAYRPSKGKRSEG